MVTGAPRPGARIPRFIASLNRPADYTGHINLIELDSEHGLTLDANRRDGVTRSQFKRYPQLQTPTAPWANAFVERHSLRSAAD